MSPVASTISLDTCERCGENGKRKELGTDGFIEYILICITCGHDTIKLRKNYYEDNVYQGHFNHERQRSWERGLRKYRNKSKGVPFKGDPFAVALKNLGALANMIEILGGRSELDSVDYDKIQDILTLIFNKLFKDKVLLQENIEIYTNQLFNPENSA